LLGAGLGPTALSAFPMVAREIEGGETCSPGCWKIGPPCFGALAQVEALSAEPLEVRRMQASPGSPKSRDDRSPIGV